jgi:hypothetical protein
MDNLEDIKIMGTKIITVSTKRANGKVAPKILISGDWLNEIGFKIGKLFSVKYLKGSLILKLEGDPSIDNYEQVVKVLLKDNSFSLLRVYNNTSSIKNKDKFPTIHIVGLRLNKLGFAVGSFVAVVYEYGIIKLKLLDIDKIQSDF